MGDWDTPRNLGKTQLRYVKLQNEIEKCLIGQRHFNALLKSQTVVPQSFNAQPEAPASARPAGASGWALNDAPEINYAC